MRIGADRAVVVVGRDCVERPALLRFLPEGAAGGNRLAIPGRHARGRRIEKADGNGRLAQSQQRLYIWSRGHDSLLSKTVVVIGVYCGTVPLNLLISTFSGWISAGM